LNVVDTRLPGLKIITPERHRDARGFFSESYSRQRMASVGIAAEFVQDNHSVSAATGTVRGLHFQSPPHAQDKLVRCGRGCLFDVAVDIRVGSPTFGQWEGVELSQENGRQLFVPAGFLHGFVTRMPDTEIIYKCSDYHAPDCEVAVQFDDPAIDVDWGVARGDAVVSDKDRTAGLLADLQSPFVFQTAQS